MVNSGRAKLIFEEIFLYSGQFGLFYIIMQVIIERISFFSNTGHIGLLFAMLAQAALLGRLGGNWRYRLAFSFLVPLVYSLIELREGLENINNAAHVGFWIYAAVSALLMLVRQSRKEIVQQLSDIVIVFINVAIFLFLYFYFDTVKEVNDPALLTIDNIFKNVDSFLKDPTHWYVIWGGAFLALTIAFGRYELHRLKDRIASLFGKYVDKGLRDTVIEKGEFTASRKNLCILFSDIVNFTSLCERHEAEEVSGMLNVYFEYWNAVIKRHKGTVDKYIGDAIMVIFGLEDEGAACGAAVRCALEASRGRERLVQALKSRSLPIPEGFGIGCHYGELIIGDIGSSDRKNITVVGDTVNVAARLEAVTRSAGNPVVISGTVHERLGAEERRQFDAIGSVELKGKKEKISIWGSRKQGS